MAFQIDQRLAGGAARKFGEYITTFQTPGEQVRGDIFDDGKSVVAHVSFTPGFSARNAPEPYIEELWNFARERGVRDRFRVVYLVTIDTPWGTDD